MWMRTTHMTERTRWLIGSGLMFAWTFGISAWTLTRYGYGIHDWLWWLVCAFVGAAVSLAVGWISACSPCFGPRFVKSCDDPG